VDDAEEVDTPDEAVEPDDADEELAPVPAKTLTVPCIQAWNEQW